MSRTGNQTINLYTSTNHPKAILRELPKPISKRMPELSSGKEIFQKPTPIYFEVLKNVDSMDL